MQTAEVIATPRQTAAGKVVVLTGGTTGLGVGLLSACLEADKIYLLCRSLEKGAQLVAQYPEARIELVRCELSRMADVKAAAEVLCAAGRKIAQKGEGAGEGGDVLKHGGVPIRAVDCDGGGDLVGTDKVEHRVFEATAHGGADLGEGGRGEAELGQGVGVGAVDRGEVVDERAIEIEEKGAKGHDGCKVGQGRWAVVSGSEVSG
jgi:hypothetical protein